MATPLLKKLGRLRSEADVARIDWETAIAKEKAFLDPQGNPTDSKQHHLAMSDRLRCEVEKDHLDDQLEKQKGLVAEKICDPYREIIFSLCYSVEDYNWVVKLYEWAGRLDSLREWFRLRGGQFVQQKIWTLAGKKQFAKGDAVRVLRCPNPLVVRRTGVVASVDVGTNECALQLDPVEGEFPIDCGGFKASDLAIVRVVDRSAETVFCYDDPQPPAPRTREAPGEYSGDSENHENAETVDSQGVRELGESQTQAIAETVDTEEFQPFSGVGNAETIVTEEFQELGGSQNQSIAEAVATEDFQGFSGDEDFEALDPGESQESSECDTHLNDCSDIGEGSDPTAILEKQNAETVDSQGIRGLGGSQNQSIAETVNAEEFQPFLGVENLETVTTEGFQGLGDSQNQAIAETIATGEVEGLDGSRNQFDDDGILLIPLADIHLDERKFQPRANYVDGDYSPVYDEEAIARYQEMLELGCKFDPVDLVRLDGKLYLFHGHHRLKAHQQAGRDRIRATIHEINEQQAIAASCTANTCNPVPLATEHRLLATERFLNNQVRLPRNDERRTWAIRQIARAMGVSHKTVIICQMRLDMRPALTEFNNFPWVKIQNPSPVGYYEYKEKVPRGTEVEVIEIHHNKGIRVRAADGTEDWCHPKQLKKTSKPKPMSTPSPDRGSGRTSPDRVAPGTSVISGIYTGVVVSTDAPVFWSPGESCPISPDYPLIFWTNTDNGETHHKPAKVKDLTVSGQNFPIPTDQERIESLRQELASVPDRNGNAKKHAALVRCIEDLGGTVSPVALTPEQEAQKQAALKKTPKTQTYTPTEPTALDEFERLVRQVVVTFEKLGDEDRVRVQRAIEQLLTVTQRCEELF